MIEKERAHLEDRMTKAETNLQRLSEDMKLLTEEYDLLNRKVYNNQLLDVEYR